MFVLHTLAGTTNSAGNKLNYHRVFLLILWACLQSAATTSSTAELKGNISRSGWYSPVVVGLTGNIKASHQEQSADRQQIDVCIRAFQRCTEHVTHVEQMESLCLCVKGKGKEVYFTNKKIYKHSGGPGPWLNDNLYRVIVPIRHNDRNVMRMESDEVLISLSYCMEPCWVGERLSFLCALWRLLLFHHNSSEFKH